MKQEIITKVIKDGTEFYFSPHPYYIKNSRLGSYKESSDFKSKKANNNFEEQNILGLPSVSYYEDDKKIKVYENRVPLILTSDSISSTLKGVSNVFGNNQIKYISKTVNGEDRIFEDKNNKNLNLSFLDDDILTLIDNNGEEITADNFTDIFNLNKYNQTAFVINSSVKINKEIFTEEDYSDKIFNQINNEDKINETFFDNIRLLEIQNNQIKGVYSKYQPYCLFKHSGNLLKKVKENTKYNLRYQLSSSYIFDKINFIFISSETSKKMEIIKYNTSYINEQILFDNEYDTFEIYAEIRKITTVTSEFENFIINNISLKEIIPSIKFFIDVNSFDYYIESEDKSEITGYLNTELEKELLYTGMNLNNADLIKIKSKREGVYKGKDKFSQIKIIDYYE